MVAAALTSSMAVPATTPLRTGAPKFRSTAARGTNTLVLRAAAMVNLANVDQTAFDATNVANFQNVDASALTSGATITGSASANTIIGGTGADVIDGGGGADTIAAGAGNDLVYVHGSEISIDGGDGNDTLVLPNASTVTAVNFSVAAGLDQTAGDVASVVNFENLDATAMTTALSVTGSLLANTILTGSGNDTIRGGGGGDVIDAGAGNDAVDYWGTEVSIDGGTGSNTLVLRASADIDLSAVDQSLGDSTAVANFTNVNASAVSTGVSILGSSAANIITGGSGADTIDGNGGADVISAGAGADVVTIHGTEASVDGGLGSDTLVVSLGSAISAVNFAVVAGADQTSGDTVTITNFENLDASALATALTVTGSSVANTILTGAGNDIVDGGGGADIINTGAGDDTVTYYGTEASINAGAGVNTLVMRTATDIDLGHVDQTVGDAVTVSNFQNVDASLLGSAQGINILGNGLANIITGGAGNDTIDGGGGADVIDAGAGNDTVAYRGTETSIAGGSGTNTLQLKAVTTVDLAHRGPDFRRCGQCHRLQECRCQRAFGGAGRFDYGRRAGQCHHGWRGCRRYRWWRWCRRHQCRKRRRYRSLSRCRNPDRWRLWLEYTSDRQCRRHHARRPERRIRCRPDHRRHRQRRQFPEHRRIHSHDRYRGHRFIVGKYDHHGLRQ